MIHPDQTVVKDTDLLGYMLDMAWSNTSQEEARQAISSIKRNLDLQQSHTIEWSEKNDRQELDSQLFQTRLHSHDAFVNFNPGRFTGTEWMARENYVQGLWSLFMAGIENIDAFENWGRTINTGFSKFPQDPYIALMYQIWQYVYSKKK